MRTIIFMVKILVGDVVAAYNPTVTPPNTARSRQASIVPVRVGPGVLVVAKR